MSAAVEFIREHFDIEMTQSKITCKYSKQNLEFFLQRREEKCEAEPLNFSSDD